MDQLVFVHGVATRKCADYGLQVRNRDALFRDVAWRGKQVSIRNPYWGDLGVAFSHGLASLPGKAPKATAFDLGGAQAGPTSAVDDQPLAALAGRDFGAAVDAIFVAMIDRAEGTGNPLTPEQIAQFTAAGDYATANTDPLWARAARFDQDIVDELQKRIASAKPESFGLGDAIGATAHNIGTAARDIAERARNLAATGIAPMLRGSLSPALALFLGDVFVYLYGDEATSQRKNIRKVIADELNAAARDARDRHGRLVVIGHSFGGVILYDMLARGTPELDGEVKIDLFVSVGSQPALFQEMSLFGVTVEEPFKAPAPGSVGHWWNVYDPVDLLAFRCEPVFADVVDFEFSSATGLIDAHGSYFKRPRFHARLRERLGAIAVVS